jgi:hypothetical protein
MSSTIYRRPIVDPIAADRDLGQRIADIERDIGINERKLSDLRSRFMKITQQIMRLESQRDALVTWTRAGSGQEG